MTRRAGAWVWRCRRNPLRRTSDVVEAWILLAAWVLAVAGGLVAGLLTAGAVQQAAERVRADTRAVSAVLAGEPAPGAAVRPAGGALMWGTVRWTDGNGATHTDRTRVAATAAPGTRVTVWTNERGALTAPPPSPADTAFQTGLGGLWAGTATAALALGGAKLARTRLDRHRFDQWAEDWARMDTWGRKTG